MCSEKKYPLSLSGDTFNALKTDFDQQLRQLLSEMERRESEDASITIKIAVNLSKDQERDFEANGYDAMKDIVRPSFKHEVSTVMQVKSNKSGSLSGNYKLVWDRELCQYVMQEIDNGQLSVFDNPEPAALPYGNAVDAEYSDVGDDGDEDGKEDGEESADSSAGGSEVSVRLYEHLKLFVGQELRVTESMGNITVRNGENKVVLSSGFPKNSPCYCSAETLKSHVGHNVICVNNRRLMGANSIDIFCEDCGETILAAFERDGD